MFLEEAVEALRELAAKAPLTVLDVDYWEKLGDGNFHRVAKTTPDYASLHHHFKLDTLSKYEPTHVCILADPVVGPQMDRLFGAPDIGGSRIGVDSVLFEFVAAMVDENGVPVFTSETYEAAWTQIMEPLYSPIIRRVAIAPLPGLRVEKVPIELMKDLVIDRLDDDEVRLCIRAGLIRPPAPGFTFVDPQGGMGIRWITAHTKYQSDEDMKPTPQIDLGSFGQRPSIGVGYLMEDVVTIWRLLKSGAITYPGYATWIESRMRQGYGCAARPETPSRPGGYNLSEAEAASLKELWQVLSGGLLKDKKFRFIATALRRFMFSFDRSLPDDRLVDLLIAAESLFLQDTGDPPERGELRFRLSLRAGKFIEHEKYSQRDVYTVMRRAYNLRSMIVHGGEVGDIALPDVAKATFGQFTDVIEEIIRLGLKKSLKIAGVATSSFRISEYWESLLFPGCQMMGSDSDQQSRPS